MTLLCVASVYDSVADTFGPPVCDVNGSACVRAFVQAVNTPGTQMQAHARDLVLFELGTFDNVTGRFSLLDDERQLIRGADCLQPEVSRGVQEPQR